MQSGLLRGLLLIFSCAIFLVVLPASYAQTGTGTVAGQITDPSGAVVPNVNVTATSAAGRTVSATSDAQGSFLIHGLAAGAYTVTAAASGFATFQQSGVQVTAGRTANLKIALAIASAQAQVEVQAQPVQVSVAPSENASSVSISGSNLQSLADDPDALATQIQELAGPSAGPNGAEIYVDGFTGADLPPKEAIREIKVNQNPFSAVYDRLGYGRVEILTKPGSDQWHGSGFVFGNDSAFNSKSPFLAGISEPPYHTLMYGGRLGGPLGKKASFFVGLEHRDINRDNVVNTETLNSSLQQAQFTTAVPNPRVLTSLSPRVDYQLSANNTLSVRYHYFGVDEKNDGIGTQSLPSQAYTNSRHHHMVQASDTQIISPRIVDETRFEYLHFNDSHSPQDFSPTIQVLGAFTGGGYSGGRWARNETHYEAQNLLTMTLNKHYVQLGGFLRDIARSESADSNFNGTFYFNSLADYQATQQDLANGMTMAQIQAAGVGPSQFNITQGNPFAAINRLDGALWAQDDWKFRPNLTLSYGLRFETENVISDHADFAPRLGLAWGLGHGQQVKTVLRAGFGIFYDRFDDDEMIVAQRLNGINQLSYVLYNPAFFPAIPPPSTLSGSAATAPTIYRIAPNLKSPYAMESAASIERQVTKDATVSVTYLNSRGNRQLLTNDVNAPLPGTFDPANPSSGVRPLGAAAGNIYQYVSQGIFRQNQVIANFRAHHRWMSLFGYYSFNDVKSDTAGVDSFATNPYNILEDYGRAQFGVRQRVFVGGSVAAPFGLQLYPMVFARSGIPFSITLGEDLFGTGIHNGRPAYASAATPAADVRSTPYGTFDINPGATAALVPPNTATGPSAIAFNLRVTRTFGFGALTKGGHNGGGGDGGHDHHHGGLGGRGLSSGGGFGGEGGGTEHRYALTLSVEGQNIFNNVNLGIPVGDLNSPLFGRSIALTGGPYSGEGDANRRINLRLSFSF